MARVTLIVVFLIGILVAADEDSVIFFVVSYAWAGLGASFGPLTLCCLYWRRTTMQGAIAGMVAGTATVLIWHNLLALLPAFLVSFVAIFVVSKLTPEPSQEVLDTFDHYMDADAADEEQARVDAVRVEKATAEAVSE